MNKNFVANDVAQLFPSDESFDALASIIGCVDHGIAMARRDGKFVIWNGFAQKVLFAQKLANLHKNPNRLTISK